MKRILLTKSFLLALGLVASLSSLSVQANDRKGELSFGWATESIVPNRPVAIGGQYHTRISGEVHDPLTVTALALETKDERGVIDQVVWVSCDLVAIRARTVADVRKLVAKAVPDLDGRKIIISATHTHTAPALTDSEETDLHPYEFFRSWAYRIPADQVNVMRPLEYLDLLERQIAVAVTRAWQARQPGEFSFALSHASVARNRRAVYFDGTARMYGDTKDPNFSHTEGSSDDSIDALFFWRDDKLVGVAVTVYCPAQEVEGENHLSADFWFDTRQQLQEHFSPQLFILPLTGASGDQSPHIQVARPSTDRMLAQQKVAYRQEIARRITSAVAAVTDAARASKSKDVFLSHRLLETRLPVWKVPQERYQQAKQVVDAVAGNSQSLSGPDYINWRVQSTMLARYKLQEQEPTFQIELHGVRLNDLALVTNPFELFNDYSLRIKARSPAVQTSVVQLTSDCAAYLATERAVQGGGYSARIDDGVIGPEGGRQLVEDTTRLLNMLWKGTDQNGQSP